MSNFNVAIDMNMPTINNLTNSVNSAFVNTLFKINDINLSSPSFIADNACISGFMSLQGDTPVAPSKWICPSNVVSVGLDNIILGKLSDEYFEKHVITKNNFSILINNSNFILRPNHSENITGNFDANASFVILNENYKSKATPTFNAQITVIYTQDSELEVFLTITKLENINFKPKPTKVPELVWEKLCKTMAEAISVFLVGESKKIYHKTIKPVPIFGKKFKVGLTDILTSIVDLEGKGLLLTSANITLSE